MPPTRGRARPLATAWPLVAGGSCARRAWPAIVGLICLLALSIPCDLRGQVESRSELKSSRRFESAPLSDPDVALASDSEPLPAPRSSAELVDPFGLSPDFLRRPIAPQTPPSDTERGRRQERRGIVVSNAMDKTIVVKVDVIKAHPRYKKVVRRSVKFHAHDESNTANVGDVVRIVETRPLSATKRWRLAEIVEVAK